MKYNLMDPFIWSMCHVELEYLSPQNIFLTQVTQPTTMKVFQIFLRRTKKQTKIEAVGLVIQDLPFIKKKIFWELIELNCNS